MTRFSGGARPPRRCALRTGHRRRRHRPVGRLDDGASRRCASDARTPRWHLPLPMRSVRVRMLAGCAGGGWNRAADRAARAARSSSTLAGPFRCSVALPKASYRGRRQLHRVSLEVPVSSARVTSGGVIPTQLPVFVAIAAAYFRAAASLGDRAGAARDRVLAHGARYAGIPVARRIGLVYVLIGSWRRASPAIIYVAHLGQARSDAGTGYELDAITAGRARRHVGRSADAAPLRGTLLGLCALAVLQTGCISLA